MPYDNCASAASPPCWNAPASSESEAMAPIDLISCLVADELTRRGDPPTGGGGGKQAAFRDPQKTLDHFDFPSIRR